MSERSTRNAEAWFIPSESPERWLEELSRCGLAQLETRIFLIPRTPTDLTPAGILAVPGRATPLLKIPSGLACAWIGKFLCVPADAETSPPITPKEADELCAGDVVFLHPTLGATRFTLTDTVSLHHLVSGPSLRRVSWNLAQSARCAPRDLTHIALASPPRLGDIFGDAASTIASTPPDQLPPSSDELAGGTPSLADQLKDWVARGIEGAARRGPGDPEDPKWTNPLTRWAERHLSRESQSLDQERQKELRRLLAQLEQDPESGLRHAIPLHELPHRGRAKPGSRLGIRIPDFNSSKLGGEPADFWEAPADLQAKLRRAYDELANRELTLGNFRRAAYIYAHLLGDLSSAANALKQGKHFREAAILYEERMQNPEQAARCLEEGDLLQEALELFQKLGLDRDIARIHEKRGEQPLAQQIWRRIISKHHLEKDFLEAARLLEEKLGSPAEAATELLLGWPDSPQAIPCLYSLLELWSRLGAHESTIGMLHRLRESEGAFWKQDEFLEILIQQARRHPEPRVRTEAANLSLVVISRRLLDSRLAPRTISRLASHLTELAPQDRLLCRDANRYVGKRRQQGAAMSKRLANDGAADLAAREPGSGFGSARLQLPAECEWVSFRVAGPALFGLGRRGKDLVVLRASWLGAQQTHLIPDLGRLDLHASSLEPLTEDGHDLLLRLGPVESVPEFRFPVASPDFPHSSRVRSPAWLPEGAQRIKATSQGVWSLELKPAQARLFHQDLEGRLLRTFDVSEALLAEMDPGEEECCLAAYLNGVALSRGNRLVILSPSGMWQPYLLPSTIRHLSVDPATPGKFLLVATDDSVACYEFSSQTWQMIDDTLASPVPACVGGGNVVIHSSGGTLLWKAGEGMDQTPQQIPTPGREIVAALPGPRPGTFALVDQRGQLTVHESRLVK